MNKTLFFCLIVCLFSWTNTSAQTKPNPIWEKDFVDTCVVIPLGVDFGLCAMPLGWALSDSGCVMLSGCSMIGSNGTDYSTSFFQSSYQCNGSCIQDTTVLLACIDSNQINLNVLCPAIYEPVCGCDSITYSNSCEATNYGGVVSFTQGECGSAKLTENWMSFIDIQPNPFSSNWTLKNDPLLLLTVRMIQSNGVVLFTKESTSVLLEFDGENFAPGTYFVEITNRQNGHKVVKRLVKE
jgi:hypothetical protein